MDAGKLRISYLEFNTEILDFAKQCVKQKPTEAHHCVAKALLDSLEESRKARTVMDEQKGDLAPYLDFWMGDAVEDAKILKSSSDPKTRNLAEALLQQEQAIIQSKESVLNAIKKGFLKYDPDL